MDPPTRAPAGADAAGRCAIALGGLRVQAPGDVQDRSPVPAQCPIRPVTETPADLAVQPSRCQAPIAIWPEKVFSSSM
jgi:hypothetical protein